MVVRAEKRIFNKMQRLQSSYNTETFLMSSEMISRSITRFAGFQVGICCMDFLLVI